MNPFFPLKYVIASDETIQKDWKRLKALSGLSNASSKFLAQISEDGKAMNLNLVVCDTRHRIRLSDVLVSTED